MALVLCQEAGTSAQICLPETCSGLGATTFLPAGRVISMIVDGTGSSKKTEPAEKNNLVSSMLLLSMLQRSLEQCRNAQE